MVVVAGLGGDISLSLRWSVARILSIISLPHDPLDRFDQHPIYSEAELILKLIDGEVAHIFLYNLVGEVVVDAISTIFPG